ncbi:MAG TPA: urease accessory protein [Desulfobulbaceae bacterium]|nr:urease accessory protein [Desulfobulbaceae bacterium]
METEHGTGWTGRLRLEYARKNGRTILAGNSHSGPLMVQRPLYPEGDVCHTCILHPPGGVVGGDRLEIDVTVGREASALITTPGATKFYRSGGRMAVQEQQITVAGNGLLEWFPQENILFPGAEATIRTRVSLGPTARFIGWEILCLGLPVNNEPFSTGRADTTLTLDLDDKPVFLDRLRVTNSNDLEAPAGLQSFPVCATFVATTGNGKLLETLRALTCREKEALFGVTLVDGLLVARYLGHSTFGARELFTDIWQRVRPEIAGRESCLPRIWAT